MKTKSIDIRKAEAGDAEGIAEVHYASWSGAYSGIIPHKTLTGMLNRRGPKWWANAIRKASSILIVEMNGEVVGYATLGRNRSRDLKQQGEIYEIYLKPEYQGIGLGSKLFDAARDKLSAHGLKGFVVWALEDNVGATDFYAGAGGRDVAEGVEIFEQKALKKVAFVWP
jgi:ribosomal protein S18 acetylase RimI-like enzyme